MKVGEYWTCDLEII